MGVIPRRVYRQCEWQLHNAAKQARLLREAWEDILEDALPGGGFARTGGGTPGDRTAGCAIRLGEKSRSVQQAERWLDCIRDTRTHFAGTTDALVADTYYGSGQTILQAADALHYEKQTINRYRDRYVTFLALLAASRGLIDMDKARETEA